VTVVCRLENNIRAIIYRTSFLCVRHKGMGEGGAEV